MHFWKFPWTGKTPVSLPQILSAVERVKVGLPRLDPLVPDSRVANQHQRRGGCPRRHSHESEFLPMLSSWQLNLAAMDLSTLEIIMLCKLSSNPLYRHLTFCSPSSSLRRCHFARPILPLTIEDQTPVLDDSTLMIGLIFPKKVLKVMLKKESYLFEMDSDNTRKTISTCPFSLPSSLDFMY
jgi:hypothetical protein